jgi:hypothetical protein
MHRPALQDGFEDDGHDTVVMRVPPKAVRNRRWMELVSVAVGTAIGIGGLGLAALFARPVNAGKTETAMIQPPRQLAPAIAPSVPARTATSSAETRPEDKPAEGEPLPEPVVSALAARQFQKALIEAERRSDLESQRDAWREQVRDRWLDALRSEPKVTSIDRTIDALTAFRAHWPKDPEARRLLRAAEARHQEALKRLTVRLAELGIPSELRASSAGTREYSIEGRWVIGRDARLAAIADPKVGTLEIMAEIVDHVARAVHKSDVRLRDVQIWLVGSKVALRFPAACAEKWEAARGSTPEARVGVLACAQTVHLENDRRVE